MKKQLILLTALTLTIVNVSYSQISRISGQDNISSNPITTAVPFITISPDSRSASMGDAGVALSPDGFSQNYNSSKYAFIENKTGFTINYTPWLSKLIDDMNLAYLSGYYKIDQNQAIGASLRYFSLGLINFSDDYGMPNGSFSPHEFAVDASYNRKLAKNFSLGIAGRFIYSNLTGGQGTEGSKSGTSAAMDINGYYTNNLQLMGYNGNYALGFNISNIGAKLSYTEDIKNFIPTNLKIGGAATINIDDYNSISATLEINKLLIPTPPIYYQKGDTMPNNEIVLSSNTHIKYGTDNEVGIVQGVLQSFYDAPGGFKEEMQELTFSAGIEYWYAKQFAVRAGYFHEHQNKGNRKYFTAGIGLKMSVFGLDFSYLMPAGAFNTSPLQNTWRFSLTFNFDDFSNQ